MITISIINLVLLVLALVSAALIFGNFSSMFKDSLQNKILDTAFVVVIVTGIILVIRLIMLG